MTNATLWGQGTQLNTSSLRCCHRNNGYAQKSVPDQFEYRGMCLALLDNCDPRTLGTFLTPHTSQNKTMSTKYCKQHMSSMNSQLRRLAWDQNGEENSSTLLNLRTQNRFVRPLNYVWKMQQVHPRTALLARVKSLR